MCAILKIAARTVRSNHPNVDEALAKLKIFEVYPIARHPEF